MGLKRQIVQWGNSLGVRIPSKIFQQTRFKEDDEVRFEVKDEDTLLMAREDTHEE